MDWQLLVKQKFLQFSDIFLIPFSLKIKGQLTKKNQQNQQRLVCRTPPTTLQQQHVHNSEFSQINKKAHKV